MEKKYYLAIDIGASSGRHILGYLDDGKLVLEEVFRFKNGAIEKNGSLVWDIVNLKESIIEGLKKCREVGKIPVSVGIDTWGVDYALLDENDNLIGDVFSYRDSRTEYSSKKVEELISDYDCYERTGIQKHAYNTIYQLFSDKLTGKIDNAKTMLFTPDYLAYVLTGVKQNEYTIASTSGLINAKTRNWDWEIIDKLGFKRDLFMPLNLPGTVIGNFTNEIVDLVGFNASVVVPGSHDTASAVLAVPNTKNPLYISSGTWSLIGIENDVENTSKKAFSSGFSNEGGYNKSIRFLKNIMGLWMIQCIKKEYDDKYSFSDFVIEAEKVKDFSSIVDVNDDSFFAPKSMIKAVCDYCAKTEQKPPKTVGETVLCVYESLAKSYLEATTEIEKLYDVKFDTINIVGGGCQNDLLNKLTAKWTKKRVVAGPVEATATGNIVSQMITFNEVASVADAKNLIDRSFDVKIFE